MTRTAGTVFVMFTTVAFAEPPIKPTFVSWEGKETPAIEVIDSIAKQAGIPIDRSSIPKERIVKQVYSNKPFWDVLTAITKEAGCKIVVQGSGERLKIVPVEKTLMPPVSSSGTFLVTAKSLTAKFDYDTGKSTHEAAIEIIWEPRQKVFRVGQVKANANFTYCELKDDTVLEWTRFWTLKSNVESNQSKINVTGSHHVSILRMNDIKPLTTSVSLVEGSITVTAAEKMLRIAFDDLAAKQPSKSVEKVNVTLSKWGKLDDLWEARVELTYPPGMPEFESFEAESWLRDNACRLVSPDRSKSFESKDFQVKVTKNGAVIDYRFTEDKMKGLLPGKGWSLEVDTPSPLLEFPVKFELKRIRLP